MILYLPFKTDPLISYRELEAMLHCQIATASNLALLRMSVSRPHESIAAYKPLRRPHDTNLNAKLKVGFKDMVGLTRLFKYAREATSELGEWCADQMWSFGLADEEARKVERKIERSYVADKDSRPIEEQDAEINRLRDAMAIVKDWTFPPPNTVANSLSSKVQLLQKYLELIFEKPTDARCIIFVKRRYTARLLGELFSRIGTPHLRLGLLIGTRTGDAGDIKFTFRQQVLTLVKFKSGELNCLVCRSRAWFYVVR